MLSCAQKPTSRCQQNGHIGTNAFTPEFINSIAADAPTGYTLECDIEVLIELHTELDDFPLLPKKMVAPQDNVVSSIHLKLPLGSAWIIAIP